MNQPSPKRPEAELRWVKPPRQQRSQETLDRLLEAAEAIILERGVDAASVVAVTKRARSSVGSFYTRFPDRDSLVRAVCVRFGQEAQATIDAVIAPERWLGQSLEVLLETCVGFMYRVVRERRLLLTSLLGGAAHDLTLSRLVSDLVLHLAQRLQLLLVARDELRAQADPELAAKVVAGVLLSTAQARALQHLEDRVVVEESLAAKELARMCVAYLAPAPLHLPRVEAGEQKVVRIRRRT